MKHKLFKNDWQCPPDHCRLRITPVSLPYGQRYPDSTYDSVPLCLTVSVSYKVSVNDKLKIAQKADFRAIFSEKFPQLDFFHLLCSLKLQKIIF